LYIRPKVIKGHTYYYLVKSVREGAKVRQRVIKYLGKHPGSRGHVSVGYAEQRAVVQTPSLPAGRPFVGKAFRAESGLLVKGKTAQDIVDFEACELGNADIKQQAEALGINLSAIPETDVVWVTKSLKEAEWYGEHAAEVDLPAHAFVLAEDGEGGFLVYRGDTDFFRAEPSIPTGTDGAPQRSAWVEKREQARELIDDALNDLAEALAAGKSDALTAYLTAMARLRSYSLPNQIRIAVQRPGATDVAGFREWQKRGRYVRKGERGILITAPVIRKQKQQTREQEEDPTPQKSDEDEYVTGYRGVYVFDISQTEGPPLPPVSPVSQASGDPGVYAEKLKSFIAEQGITLEYRENLSALGFSSGGRVVIRAGLSPVEEFTTLAHELAHEFIHQKAATRAPKTVRETEAEAVAHVVSTAIGLETTRATADYIQLYQGNTETLYASLKTIQSAANTILQGLGL
jgi:hypothetical protein